MFGVQNKPMWGTSGGFGNTITATTSAVPGSAFRTMGGVAPTAVNTTAAAQNTVFAVPSYGFNTIAPAQTQLHPPGQAAMDSAATQAAAVASWQDFARQSALASYMHEFDKAYNALHPQCRFRAFMYNACGAGQAVDAIQRERYIAFLHGGGCTVEDYAQAQQVNSDPMHLYPSPVHFAQELQRRVAKQREALELCVRRAENLLQDVAALVTMQEEHQRIMRTLREQEAMLRSRWFSVLHHCELLRRVRCTSAEENLLLQRVQTLRGTLALPGQYRNALDELQPYLDMELVSSSRSNNNGNDAASGDSVTLENDAKLGGRVALGGGGLTAPLLRPEVDAVVLRDWLRLARKMQNGVEALHALLKQDLTEMSTTRMRCSG